MCFSSSCFCRLGGPKSLSWKLAPPPFCHQRTVSPPPKLGRLFSIIAPTAGRLRAIGAPSNRRTDRWSGSGVWTGKRGGSGGQRDRDESGNRRWQEVRWPGAFSVGPPRGEDIFFCQTDRNTVAIPVLLAPK